ncbi:MAG TPA: thiamine phosphate synthase [Oscillospiraceae bacterium]|nr:thiamine phosphate synthase [Oscillospiraceae bacterium]
MTRSFLQTDIYGITCEAMSAGRSNLETVRELLQAGVQIIQYREKEKTKREKFAQCLALSKMCKKAGALFIVNDDVDIALAAQADGVHVGQDDLPADIVRALVGSKVIVGVSAGNTKEAAAAVACGADYLGVGPIFATGTKLDAGAPIGLEFLAYLKARYTLPLVAIGGINPENITQVFQSGADSAAMISALVSSSELGATVRATRQRLKEHGFAG